MAMLSTTMITSIQSIRPIRAPRGAASGARLVALVASFVVSLSSASTLRAQESSVATNGTSLRMSAQMVVGYRMRVREVAPPRVVDRAPGMTELELNLEAASNVAWRLTIAAPVAQDSATQRIEVRDAAGTWQRIDRFGPGVLVVAHREPCNPTPLTIRVRVYEASVASFATPRFTMDVAGGL